MFLSFLATFVVPLVALFVLPAFDCSGHTTVCFSFGRRCWSCDRQLPLPSYGPRTFNTQLVEFCWVKRGVWCISTIVSFIAIPYRRDRVFSFKIASSQPIYIFLLQPDAVDDMALFIFVCAAMRIGNLAIYLRSILSYYVDESAKQYVLKSTAFLMQWFTALITSSFLSCRRGQRWSLAELLLLQQEREL